MDKYWIIKIEPDTKLTIKSTLLFHGKPQEFDQFIEDHLGDLHWTCEAIPVHSGDDLFCMGVPCYNSCGQEN